jgi:lipopolysaccharide transport system permease protein
MPQNYETVIIRRKGWIPIDFRELWVFRELLFFLSWRDIKVKYKQSLLGIAWVILRPVVGMVIFSILFGRIAKFPSEGVPYPIFVFIGLLPWTYFSTSLTASTTSLVSGANLVSKIYFPRIMIPMSANLSNMLDFFISLTVLIIMMIYYKIIPQTGIILAPIFIFAIFITALGPGMLFSALNVRYRDVGYVVPFIVQIWMFLTPVIYPVSFIPEKYRLLMYLNPMSGLIESFRASVLGHMELNMNGLFYFKKVEQTFADVI